MPNIESSIRNYLTDNMLFGDESLKYSDTDSLIDVGIIDSIAVLEIVLFAQETYGIPVEDHEIIPENFDSIANLARFIRDKQNNHSPE